jgi:hypothetical protein
MSKVALNTINKFNEIVETHLRPTSFFNKEEKDNFTVLANGRLY